MSIENIYTVIGGQHRFQYMIITMVVISQFNNALNILKPIFINNSQDLLCITRPNETSSVFSNHRAQFSHIDNVTGYLVLSNSRCFTPTIHCICSSVVIRNNVMTSTIRQQYRLICEYSHLASLSVFMLMMGVCIGSVSGGPLVDRFGRIKGCVMSYYMLSIFATLSAVSPNFTLYALAQFFVGMAVSFGFISNSAMVLESVALKNRTVFGFLWTLGYDTGYLLLVLLAYFIRNHVRLQITICCISYVSLIFPFFYRESFRWLLANEYYDKTRQTIQYIARFNGKCVSDEHADGLINAYHEQKMKDDVKRVNIMQIFKYKVVLINMLILWFIYFSSSFSYYTFLLGSSKVSSNLFIATTISAVLSLLFRVVYMLLCTRVGRISVLVSLQLSLAVMFISSIILKMYIGGHHIIITVLLMIAISISGTNFGFMWIYGGETFPTVIRSTSVSIGSAGSRISGMIASQMESVLETSPNLLPIIGAIMAVIGLISALFVLPETFNRPSLDFLEQAEKEFVKWRQPWRRRRQIEIITVEKFIKKELNSDEF